MPERADPGRLFNAWIDERHALALEHDGRGDDELVGGADLGGQYGGDGNGNSYSNPFYLSTPNEVVNFSRAIGYDPNYSIISNVNNTIPSFSYGGHWMYWANPNNTPPLTGGNGRPYVKYASNGTDTVWFTTTEDSPQNYPNSLYAGYIKFTSSGSASACT